LIKDFNLILANHSLGIHVSDIFEYFYHGIRSAGGQARYSHFRWELDKINIILENFEDDQFTNAVLQVKKRSQGSKLYLIATELIINGRMNSSEYHGASNNDGHYENHAYWERRTSNFKKLLNEFDGIICVSEALYEGYKDLHDSIFYMPLAYCKPPRPFTMIDENEKDIDILFSGTLTPYRKTLLQSWLQAGFRVENLGAHTPEYIRADYCARTKLYVGLKLSEYTRLLSKCRSQYVLNNNMPHLFEPVPCPTDMDEYLNFIPLGKDTFKYVTESLRQGHIPPCRTEDYKNSAQLSTQIIFRHIFQFCN
jgi:hypothetical protein